MVSSEKVLAANVVGGKSARACDNCVKKRAKWYCTADDAFLCQSCDSKVHSANPLARRHERVRLNTVSSSLKTFGDGLRISVPSWQKGFTRKARTPRKNRNAKNVTDETLGRASTRIRVVPEISGDEENEDQLLYRVPIFDPFVAELCTSVNSNEAGSNSRYEGETTPGSGYGSKPEYNEFRHVEGFLPSEMDLAEFAADVESLLGKGLEDESFDIESLGILDDDERERECCLGGERVMKVEDEEINHHLIDGEHIGVGRESFELDFDYYDSPNHGEDEEDSKKMPIYFGNFEDSKKVVIEAKNVFLRLDYQGVMSAWDDQRSPWTTGERPGLNPNDYWSDCTRALVQGTCGAMHVYGDTGGQAASGDGEREARVLRYREKRRTRLFSKKIRYEVRKLNAEKRPRMKGRFVKRANLHAPSTAFALL